MNYSSKIVFATFFTLAAGFFGADAQSKWGGLVPEKAQTTKSESSQDSTKKEKIKSFSALIPSTAKSLSGLFTIHQVDEKFYFEIPDSLLSRDILVVSRFTNTPVGLKEYRAQYPGEMINDQVWRWEKQGDKIFIRVPDYTHIAHPDDAISLALEKTNTMPILAAFPIKALSKDKNGTVIDVTDFFKGEIPGMVIPESLKKTYKISGIDTDRSYVDTMYTYPLNIEVKTVKTYRSPALPADKSVGAMTFGFNTSMVLLPKEPMTPRFMNPRVGYFTHRKVDFSTNEQRVTNTGYIQRWRLEPEDEAAYLRGQLVKPKKPIVYYIDPATPEKWVPYLIQGVNDWNEAFEAAGFKDAIIAKRVPTAEEDPEFSLEDARYSVIRYFASETENAYGPRVADPRSGEIIESHIGWYHNVMSLLRNWFFVQTAATNEGARGAKLTDEQMGQLVRFVSSHEVGHTIGLLHNFGSSYAFDVDSLRSKTFTDKYGTAPSIMDYARFNYVAQPGDGVTNIYPKIGAYDRFAIKFGYQYFGLNSAEVEADRLEEYIGHHVGDPLYFYGKQGTADPRSQSEDLGNDAVKASNYGIANLKRILPQLQSWIYEPGKDLSDTKELYLEIQKQFRRYVNHVMANIGGMHEEYLTMDQKGSSFTYVGKKKQQEAVDFIAENVLQAPEWLLDRTLVDRLDYGVMVNKIVEMQNHTIINLMDSYRFARLLDNEFKQGDNAYKLQELLSDIAQSVFDQQPDNIFSRGVQRSYVERLIVLSQLNKPVQETEYAVKGLTPFNPNLSDMTIYVKLQMTETHRLIKKKIGRSTGMEKQHFIDLNSKLNKAMKLWKE